MNTTECLCRRRNYEQAKDFFHFERWYHLMDSQANLWRNRFSLPGFIKPFQGHGVVSVFRYWDFRWIYFPHTLPIKRKTLKVLLNLEATPMHLNHVKRRFCKRDCFQAPSSLLPITCSWTCQWKSTQLFITISHKDDGPLVWPSNTTRIPSRYRYFSETHFTGEALCISMAYRTDALMTAIPLWVPWNSTKPLVAISSLTR